MVLCISEVHSPYTKQLKVRLQAFANNKINLNKKLKFGLGRVENTVGNGENAGHYHFIVLPLCFQKPSISGSLKVVNVW